MWGLQNYRLLGHNAELQQTDPGTKLWANYIIYTHKTHCRFDCLFGFANLFRLKSDRHETRHVGRTSRHPGRFSYYILIHSYDSFMSLNVLEKICLFVMLHLFPHWNIILLTQCMVCLMIINVSMVHKIIAKHTTILEHRNINYLIFVNNRILGRSLMIGWRKKSWNPERVPSVFTFVSVCLCVGYRARLLT